MRYFMKWLKDRFRYAFAGLRYGVFIDKSIRFQFILACLAVIAGIVLRITLNEWIWILLCITLVIVSEIFNSCLEKTVDYISAAYTDQARVIKDMAAAAVLCSSVFAFTVACLIYIPRLILFCKTL